MPGRTLCVVATVLLFATGSQAGIVFSDDFEVGSLAGWTNVGSSGLDISTDQNKVPDAGQYSAKLDSSLDGMWKNIGQDLGGPSTFSYWLYDGDATRAWAEARGYVGAGYNDGAMTHLVAIGKYNSVTMPGETFNVNKYQGRISQTGISTFYWFNLDGPGSPDRSPGWHQFTIERLADNSTFNFYVDGILSRTIEGGTVEPWDSLLMTSVRAGSSTGDAFFDGLVVTDTLVPEPGALGLLVIGALGLLARRRA